MGHDDALYRFRLRLLALAQELGNVRAACRAMDVHPSTYYRWRAQVAHYGPEILRPRERRRPRMPNATSPFVEQRVLAFSLGHPGFGPARISAELRRDKWGGIEISPNGVWRVLRRHGLSTRQKRLGLVAGYAAPPAREPKEPPPARHLAIDHPGELVQMDCSTWVGCGGPRERSGSTPPSTWPPPIPGRSCGSLLAIRPLGGPPSWPGGWPKTSLPGAGPSRRS